MRVHIVASADLIAPSMFMMVDVIVPGFSTVSMIEQVSSQHRELLAVFRGQNFMHVSSFNGPGVYLMLY